LAGKNEVELARLAYHERAVRWDSGCGAFRTLCRTGATVAVAFFAYKAITVIAGTTTIFAAVLHAAIKLSADRWVAYVFGAVGVTAYRIERSNKRKAITGMRKQIDDLENLVDPNRSRSGLAPHGGPRKEDLDDD
jgi:hypothetical protein